MFIRLRGALRIPLYLITTFFFGLQFPAPAQAQDDNPCEQFGMNAATFVARVGHPVQHQFKADPSLPVATIPAYPAVVERAFRGVATGTTVYVVTFGDAITFRNQEPYLIYGAFNFGDAREVIMPTRVVPIGDAGADLAFLNSQEALATTGRIYGRAERGGWSDQSNRQPLPNIKLRVRVGNFVTETVTDAEGRFDVAELPEGFFKIEPELPPELTTGSTGGGEIRAGGCVATAVVAQWNGIIRGRVIGADQRPMQGRVDLLPADPRIEGFPREGQVRGSNTSGQFEFGGLPPGDYVLGLNLMRPQTGTPYPATYYPGTTDRAEARVIHLGEGTVQENVDLVVPPALARGRLILRPATLANGTVFACMASGTYREPAPGEPLVVNVIDGVHYRLRLHIEETSGQHWESDPVEVVGQGGDHEMAVAVTRAAAQHPQNFECYSEAVSDSK